MSSEFTWIHRMGMDVGHTIRATWVDLSAGVEARSCIAESEDISKLKVRQYSYIIY